MEQSRYFERIRRWQRTVSALLITTLVGCTSMQTVDSTPTSLRDNLAAGDELRIVAADGWEGEVIFVAVEGDKLKAQIKDTPDVFITTPISSLETIEVRRPDARANISWGYGVILFLMLSAVAASNTN